MNTKEFMKYWTGSLMVLISTQVPLVQNELLRVALLSVVFLGSVMLAAIIKSDKSSEER